MSPTVQVEHHYGEDLQFWRNYTCAPQWAEESGTTAGILVQPVDQPSDAARKQMLRATCIAFATVQN